MTTLPTRRSAPARAAMIMVAAALVATAGCAASETVPEETSVRIGGTGFAFSPVWDKPGLGGLTAVYEALIAVDSVREYVPWLAQEFAISDDRRSITFVLRDDVDFSDGEHLDAAAVEKNFDAMIATGAIFAGSEIAYLDPEFTVTGEYEFQISTSSGIGDRFLNSMALWGLVSPVALDDPEALAAYPVGTGPYLLDEQSVGEYRVSYVRNPDYWNPDAYDFDRIEVIGFDDSVAAANALKSGQLDVATLESTQAADVERAGFTLHTGGGTVTTMVWLDRDGTLKPELADPRVRQAIAYALDREAIKESQNLGYGIVSSQVFIPAHPEYVEGGDDRYAYDLDTARELMAEAGYADGFDLTMPSWPGLAAKWGPILQQSMADIGIRVTFDALADVGVYFQASVDKTYPLIVWDLPDDYWVTNLGDGGFLNGWGPADPAIAGLIHEIDNGPTAEDRAAAAKELGEFLLEEAWYIPFSRTLGVVGSTPEIEIDLPQFTGVFSMPLSAFRLAD